MVWYEQWFDRDEYEVVYKSRNDEEATALADLVEEIARPETGGSLLDVGCGRGRHAVEFATRGYAVTGLDLSERALDKARDRAESDGLDIRFIRGDMRDAPAKDAFDGVLNLFTAFGYFERWSEHQRVVTALATAVKPGGFVVQDFLNAPYVEEHLVSQDEQTVEGTLIRQKRWIAENRIVKEIEFIRGDRSHSFFESVALLRLDDFERLYQTAGLELFAVHGDYQGSAYDEHSPRLILFSRRVI